MRRLTFLAFSVLCLLQSVNAQGAPESLGSLTEKHVNSFHVYGDTLFAACDEGLYSLDVKRRDGWKAYAFVGVKIIDFVKSGSRVLAIGWEEREYEDPDMIWYLDPFGTMLLEADGMGCASRDVTPGWVAESGEGCFFSLAQDAGNPDLIYMSCTPTKAGEYPNNYYAVFSSEDFGGQWTAATLNLASGAKMEQQLLAGPPCLHVNKYSGRVHVYGAPAVDCLCHYLYVSDDHLGTLQMIIDMYWFYDEFSAEEYERPSMHTQVVPSPHDGEEYLLKTKGYGVWKSTGGKSWNLVTERFLVDGVFYDSETEGVAYYVRHLQHDGTTWMQLYRSADGGETWTLAQEEADMIPVALMANNNLLYFHNTIDGKVYQWSLCKDDVSKTAFVKEGKQWNYRAENFFGDGYDFEFFIEGDTLIGNKAYKKLYTIDEPRYNSSEPVYCGALREERTAEAIAVDFVRAGHENVELLYNFSPLLGDKFYYGEKYGTVTELDEITVRGIKRNRIKLVVTDEDSPWPNSEDATGYWVEGIGSSAGLLTPVDFISWGYSDHLLSVYEDGDVVFTGSDFDGSSPTGISDSQYDVSAELLQGVYDLQGRRVMKMKSTGNDSSFSTLRSSFPQKGVYIVSGRKYVVK